jgi:hypothetical protein
MAKAVLKPFEVSEDEVARLTPVGLVQLIKRLIQADLQLWGAPLSAVQGTLKINISDGGEDIRVEWSGPSITPDGPGGTQNYFTVFQLKAENLTDAKLRKEPLEADGKQLKAAVTEVLDRKGTYIVVTSKTNVVTPKRGKDAKTPRLTELREVLRTSISNMDARGRQVKLDIYGPPKIADWVNRHPMIAVWMKKTLGIASSDFAFQTHGDWSSYRDLSNELVDWPVLSDQITDIQKVLLKPREVIRLLGHAGLGKSRLAFEALSADNAADLSPIVAYAREYSPNLINQVRDFIDNRYRVVLVIDECPPDGHRRLSHEVHRTDSLLSMITLDLEFDDPPPGDNKIVLDAAPDEAIKEILRTSGAILPPEDLERATEFCSGFPLIAVLVAAGLNSGAEHFADFQDPENITKKLVWGRGPVDDELFECLRCIALFEAVGVAEPKDAQLKWIASNLLEISSGNLEAKLQRFYTRRILQRRGYSILVRPRPLAAQLAATFWRNATDSQRKCLLEGSMPDELKQALCDRLSDLDYLTDARAVAAKLCGRSGPFGSAKALNTDIGARCLRSLAEVAPVDVVETIEREFGALDLQVLKQDVGPGRRWLIWTLDALAWEPSTFQQTMRLLLRFAAAENETWGNNATAEFVQRFRLQLPGTSVNLEERLSCLRSLVDGAEEDELPVLISGLTAAIDARSGTRMIGSENHGTRKTYQDYQPKLWKEIFDYARGAIALLQRISLRNAASMTMVRDAVASIDPSILISEAVFEDYKAFIEHLKPKDEIWGKLLEQFSWQLKHRLKVEDAKDVREKLLQLFANLLPKSLEERIVFFVKSVPYNFSEADEDEFDFERNRKRAEELGRECAKDWPIFERVVGRLSQGETRESASFGRAFLEATDRRSEAIQLAIRELELSEQPNQSLLGGMLFELFKLDPKALHEILEHIARAPKLKEFLPYFVSLNLTPNGLSLVIHALESGELLPAAASIFGMGRVLDRVSTQDVQRLVTTLIALGPRGAWVAVDLLSMYVHSDPSKFFGVRGEVNEALRAAPISLEGNDRTMASHHYETLVKGLLKDVDYGPSLAKFLANELIKGARNTTSSRDLTRALAELILTQYPDIILPQFASHIEMADRTDRWFFSYILGTPFSFQGKHEGPLFRLGHASVIAACKSYPKNFAVMVAEVAPLFSGGNGSKEWTDIGRALLDQFGARKDILHALSMNIGSGGWSGPTSSYLETFIPPLVQIENHPTKQVRSWARDRIRGLRAQIERELKNEEEESVRRG